MSQDQNTNDICEACGTFVELGSVIAEDDTILVLPFSGVDKESVEQLAQKYIDAAVARFASVECNKKTETTATGATCELALQFECTAEKLIFEMGLSAI